MSIQPQPTTGIFPVSFRFVTRLLDGRLLASELGASYDPQSWPLAVEALGAELARRSSTKRCLVTLRQLEPDDSTKEEHVVLQGLGTRWIYLPPGFVSDATNHGMSRSEGTFLRTGLLGSLRPFYQTRRHAKSFTDKRGRKVVFKNDPERGFTIEVYGETPPFEPRTTSSGEGEFEFDLEVPEPSPLDVSRCITKVAYLSLCVAMPDLALSPLLDDARKFIEGGRERDFRPYAERFTPGAWPGFHLNFYVEAREIGEGACAASRVTAALRLHHVLYTFTLAGDHRALPDSEATHYLSPAPPLVGQRRITWCFDRASGPFSGAPDPWLA